MGMVRGASLSGVLLRLDKHLSPLEQLIPTPHLSQVWVLLGQHQLSLFHLKQIKFRF